MPAATQQWPKQAHRRASKGNDILSKMLHLEKQSMHQRSSSAGSTTSVSESPKTSPSLPRNDQLQKSLPSPLSPTSPRQPSPLRAPQVLGSQNVSAMGSAKAGPGEGIFMEPLKIDTMKVPKETVEYDICRSPSWSDHGEKERWKQKKRGEREEREAAKHRKQEADARAAKKLTKKPPPAAMETQKLPAELRRPRRNSLMSLVSGRSSSQDRPGRSSKEERRMSATSFASVLTMRRSHSETRPPSVAPNKDGGNNEALEDEDPKKSVTSPFAPTLPSFRFTSKKASRNNSKSAAPSGNGSTEDLVAFAYQLDEPAIKKTFQDDVAQDVQQSNENMRREIFGDPNTNGVAKSQTDPLPSRPQSQGRVKEASEQSKRRPLELDDASTQVAKSQTEPLPSRSLYENKESAAYGRQKQRHPVELNDTSQTAAKDVYSGQKPRTSDEAIADLEAMLESPKYGGHHTPPSPLSPRLISRPSNDGSSYVHKQRMYQQQRSIAGFEEQEALQHYNDQAAIAHMNKSAAVPFMQGDSGGSPPPAGAKRPSSSGHRSRDRSQPRQTNGTGRKQSASPSRRGSSQLPVPVAPSPLKNVSHAPQDHIEPQQAVPHRTLKRSGEQIPSHKAQLAPPGKPDKILGFRRRSKQPPTPAQITKPEEQIKANAEATVLEHPQEQEAPKRSRIERMSAQIPFRHRRNSSSQTPLASSSQPGSKDRAKSKSRTPSSQPLNDQVKPPAPKIPATHAMTPAPQVPLPADNGVPNAWSEHKTEEAVEVTTKATDDGTKRTHGTKSSANLGASYSKALRTPSSKEPLPHVGATEPAESKVSELVVEGKTGDGVIRKTSITRPRSNPQLKTQIAATNSLPSLDFLPQLKHQPLVKANRSSQQSLAEHSPTTPKPQIPSSPPSPSTAYKSLSAIHPPDLALMPRSPRRKTGSFPTPAFNRSASSVNTPFAPGKGPLTEGLDAKPIAKLFVICCKCKFWHDLPAKLYEAMALPKELRRHADDVGEQNVDVGNSKGKTVLVGSTARLDTAVKCPWCEHAMTTGCCAGWTTVVYMHERHH